MDENFQIWWELAKFIIPFLFLLVGWAWRVELRLANHDKGLESMLRIEKSIADLVGDQINRSERLVRVETKLDILIEDKYKK